MFSLLLLSYNGGIGLRDLRIEKLLRKLKRNMLLLSMIEDIEKIKSTSGNPGQFESSLIQHTCGLLRAQTAFIVNQEDESFKVSSTNTKKDIDPNLISEIARDVVKTGQILVINSTFRHKRLKANGIKNLIAAPLFFNNEPFAAFILINKSLSTFKNEDVFLMNIIAKYSASAVEHLKGYTLLEEKNKELDIIYSIDKIRDTIRDFENMLEAVLQEIMLSLDVRISFLYLYRKDKNKSEIKVPSQFRFSNFLKKNEAIINKISNITLENSELTTFGNVAEDIHGGICIPIVLDEHNVGVFGIINKGSGEDFTEQDKTLFSAAVKQMDSALYEDIEKGMLKNMFQRYVSSEIMEQMMNEGEDYLKVKRRDVTVLFSDLRGFTSISEKLSPEKIVNMLNEHFDLMTRIILKNKGTIDKFVGDEIMAIFGAPVYTANHAFSAVKSAREMQEAQAILEDKWKKEYGVLVKMGIGINTGEMVIGNIGCKQMTDYTVIGDNVNIAARLCSKAKGGETLITQQVFRETEKHIMADSLDPISVKGKSKPLQIYRVTGLR